MQAEVIKEYLSVMKGEDYIPVYGAAEPRKDGRIWEATEQGVNERLRF